MKKKKLGDPKDFIKKISKHKNDIWTPELNIKFKDVSNDNLWFDIRRHYDSDKGEIKFSDIELPEEKTERKASKIVLFLSNRQQNILQTWFTAHASMYNDTLSFIKANIKNKRKKTVIKFNKKTNKDAEYKYAYKSLNYKILRTYFLKDKIEDNIKKSIYNNDESTKIRSHIIDAAIKLACANYKSAQTNYKNGNIKHFRIRYWNRNKDYHSIEIEPCYINKNGLCHSVFGNINAYYDSNNEYKKFDLSRVKTCSRLCYDGKLDQYCLWVTKIVKIKDNENKRKVISLDPGIRDFLTGLTEDEVLKIGTNVSERIKYLLKEVDKINGNDEIPNKIKKKWNLRTNKKITNLVNELHWQTINYLTKKYQNILIGDMSAKKIVNKNNAVINKITKRTVLHMRFYKFRERLEYKCRINKIGYAMVDESYTSKCCSRCGNKKEDLKGNKIYKCTKCKIEIERDVNGCRGIFIKHV